jgi:uncharacterized membrane protein (UPF0127 family)
VNGVLAGAAAFFFFLLAAGIPACRSEPRVIIAAKSGKEYAFRVEIADTPAKRELGLQYRNDLADDQGMLFLFPTEEVLTFWMKNTPIPLDMIFIGGDMKIVGIVRETAPFSLAPRSIGAPSRYVLEIKGGLARQKGIEAGDSARFEGVSFEGGK